MKTKFLDKNGLKKVLEEIKNQQITISDEHLLALVEDVIDQNLNDLRGIDGFSPKIEVLIDTPTEYRLKITTKDDIFSTPNFIRSSGEADMSTVMVELNSLINLADRINKEVV